MDYPLILGVVYALSVVVTWVGNMLQLDYGWEQKYCHLPEAVFLISVISASPILNIAFFVEECSDQNNRDMMIRNIEKIFSLLFRYLPFLPLLTLGLLYFL